MSPLQSTPRRNGMAREPVQLDQVPSQRPTLLRFEHLLSMDAGHKSRSSPLIESMPSKGGWVMDQSEPRRNPTLRVNQGETSLQDSRHDQVYSIIPGHIFTSRYVKTKTQPASLAHRTMDNARRTRQKNGNRPGLWRGFEIRSCPSKTVVSIGACPISTALHCFHVIHGRDPSASPSSSSSVRSFTHTPDAPASTIRPSCSYFPSPS